MTKTFVGDQCNNNLPNSAVLISKRPWVPSVPLLPTLPWMPPVSWMATIPWAPTMPMMSTFPLMPAFPMMPTLPLIPPVPTLPSIPTWPQGPTVSTELWGPTTYPRRQKGKKLTKSFMQKHHPDILAEMMLPAVDVKSAAAKFAAFVAVERLSDELDNPLSERIVASDALFKRGYKIVQNKDEPDDKKPKKNIVAIVELHVGEYSNIDLVKERQPIIMAMGIKDEKEIGNNDVDPVPSEKPRKPSIGKRLYGSTIKVYGSTIQVRVITKPTVLDMFQEAKSINLYMDLNTVAQKQQWKAIEKISEITFLQKKLAFEIESIASPPAPFDNSNGVSPPAISDGAKSLSPPAISDGSESVSPPAIDGNPESVSPPFSEEEPQPSRSRSPSVIWLDDDGDTVMCIDEISEDATSQSSSDQSTLNDEQQLAISEITRNDTANLFMLFGPPGTGKTFTLVKAIVQLVRDGNHILICTPSNKAADVISRAILAQGIGSGHPYALYRHVSRTLDPSLVDPCLRSHAGIRNVGGQACYVEDEHRNLDDYAIIVSTLGSTPALRTRVSAKKRFSHIFVDEAGQAAEMQVWLPVAFFAGDQTRLIVAGDPMQLGPVAPVHVLDDPAFGYKVSILSRLYENEAFRSDTKNMVQLTKNYRSHESIVNIVSDIFYESKLEFTRPPGHDSLRYWHRLPKGRFPIIFESIRGKVHVDINGSSSNISEAQAVVFYVQSLLRWCVNASEIGVVSPYTAQTALIRRLLGKTEVTVDTVEKFQGSERRVIIFTAVRNGKALGFLADRQRLNTALSRAQQMLIVIGHARSLKSLPDWKKFIKYCKKNKVYIKGPHGDASKL